MIMIMDLTRAGSQYYATYFSPTAIWIVGVVYVAIFLIFTIVGRVVDKGSREKVEGGIKVTFP